MNFRAAALTFCLVLSSAFAGEKNPPRPVAVKVPPPPRPPAAQANRQQANPPAVRPGPGPAVVDKLLNMTPEQREKALATLPPARRDRIEKRIENIEKMPPAQQNKVRNRLDILASMPPPRQNQIRQSMQRFNQMPVERKSQIGQEIQRMTRMPDEERRARMNSEEFRNRYSPSEQQMMGNIMEVQPLPENQTPP